MRRGIRNSMGSTVRAELTKSVHRSALWVLIAVFVVLGLIFNYIVPFISWRFPASTASAASQQSLFNGMLPGSMLPQMISGFPAFGGAIALILGALIVGSEFSWETLKTIFTQGPTRRSLFQSKLIVLLLLLLITTVLTLAAGAAGSAIFASIEHGAMNWPAALDILKAIGIGWFILTAWAALGVLLAVLFRGTGLAIGLGLIYILVIQALINGFASASSIIAAIQKALPGPNAASLAAGIIPGLGKTDTPGIVNIAGTTQAGIVLGLYLVAFVLIGVALFTRRDLA